MDDGNSSAKNNGFSKKFKQFLEKFNTEDVTEEEIISMVNEGHEQGVLMAQEAEMIHNIFEWGDKDANDIMTHKKQMIAIDGDMSYHDAVGFIIESGKSRYPVFDGDIDNIIGVLHIKDAFAFSQKNEIFRTSIKDVEGLIREVEFIPETMNINTLFTQMQSKKSHMVIVVDEYGQTSGIVAMEDILEEIVGNIEDEHDDEESLIVSEDEGCYRMDGMTDFSDVVECLSLPVEIDEYDTLNGFLIAALQKIPAEDEHPVVNMHDYEFSILSVKDNTIQEVLIKPVVPCVEEDSVIE